ncbi:glycosyltransferase [candidate division WWE3 bacterium]|uniref:Glycosyltransferase n=1 Tax=candidate division WWE3 bacterium TaxID=2053526 RepID=A0A7X9HSR8_UNCKA|nr:glycosyltransferase [candidate division WWE3 bacterium]
MNKKINNFSENKPLVSVIMPAYNAEKYISEAIESILNQTFKDFEFIILDDGSADITWEVINSYALKDSRIISVKNESNLGIVASRNKGLKISRGKYIIWADSDDISLPTRIEKQVGLMEKDVSIGICGSYIQSFYNGINKGIRKYSTSDEHLRKNIFRYSPVAQPAAIIRKECFEKVGIYNTKYEVSQDLDMSFRIGEKYKFANVPEVLLRYREHSKSATYSNVRKQIINTLKIRRKYSKGYCYKMNLLDRLAYILTWTMQFLPVVLVLRLFKFFRDVDRFLTLPSDKSNQ